MNSVSDKNYQQQLDEKIARLKELLQPFAAPAPEVFSSAPEHYRMRAEFRVWHEGDDLYYIMFDQSTRQKYRVDQLPAANTLINTLMPAVLNFIKDKPLLRHKLFQVDYLTTTTGQAVISMLYHRQLEDSWTAVAEELRDYLSQYGTINLIGRARKQKIVLGKDAVYEQLTIDNQTYEFEQTENSFTQPNAMMNQRMVQWAKDATRDSKGDLLELYCGNGNFSVPLAANFRKVLATEISKPSVHSAQYNIQTNNIPNLTIVRLAAEEVTQAIRGERVFNRLEGLDLSEFDCQTVLVDPPRAGLDEQTLQMVSAYSRILYISCNPHTLADNLNSLQKTHRITKTALFDQFPFTPHIEAGVLLERKVE